MTIRLSVRTAAWRSQITQTALSVDGLVPVIKGNGYGFGRLRLSELAAEFTDVVAVGTIHELGGIHPAMTAVVLTPTLVPPAASDTESLPVLTVGNPTHVAALQDWPGSVIVKRSSSMQRYGTANDAVLNAARKAGLDIAGVAIHPPLSGSEDERRAEVITAMREIDDDLTVWLSHLSPETYASLPTTHRTRLRLGTSLWLGDKSALHLQADVLDVRPVAAGDAAGYRLGAIVADGHLVMIGAGTANGVSPLADGRSPFHFKRARVALHEAPHMHTSMAFVPTGDPLPNVGDWLDLQRPLHTTTVDVFRWL